jgi:hypothetical protein
MVTHQPEDSLPFLGGDRTVEVALVERCVKLLEWTDRSDPGMHKLPLVARCCVKVLLVACEGLRLVEVAALVILVGSVERLQGRPVHLCGGRALLLVDQLDFYVEARDARLSATTLLTLCEPAALCPHLTRGCLFHFIPLSAQRVGGP